ncbi:hypothetical protein STEG23_009700, partial [Scotinomys teguina]
MNNQIKLKHVGTLLLLILAKTFTQKRINCSMTKNPSPFQTLGLKEVTLDIVLGTWVLCMWGAVKSLTHMRSSIGRLDGLTTCFIDAQRTSILGNSMGQDV